MRTCLLLALLLLVGALIQPPLASAQSGPTTAIRAGALFDGTSETLQRDVVILIRDGQIVEVGRDVTIPEGTEVIDLSEHTVLPGFIDLHTHLTTDPDDIGDRSGLLMRYPEYAALIGADNARKTLLAGFTTVRNVGAPGSNALALRDAIADGLVPGPRMVTAITIGTTGSHCDPTTGIRPSMLDVSGYRGYVYDGAEEARAAVRRAVRDGADLIKVCATAGVLSLTDDIGPAQMTPDELDTVVETATMLNRRTAAHAHGIEGIRNAVRAGITTIEHGSVLDDEVLAEMRERGTWLVPTMLAFEAVRVAADEGRLPPGPARKTREITPYVLESHRRAVQAGVPIAFGTDAGVFPHGENAREFALMVSVGMTPAQTLLAATRNAADALGRLSSLGTIEPGKTADMVAVLGNPLEDVSVLERMDFVMKAGEVYKRDGRAVLD